MVSSKSGLKFAVFPTAWGPAGAVTGDQGLLRFILPHYAGDDLRELLAFEHPGAVEDVGAFDELIARVRDYFNARPASFDDVACDLPAERTFAGRVLRACRSIPYGQTRSYLWLAKEVSSPDGARAAAAAIGRNPIPLIVPCHRIVYSSGKLGGFSAPGGPEQKRRMLLMEKAL